jgi:hypothetical protein
MTTTQNLSSIQAQIDELQRKALELRTTMDDPELPAAWRKLQAGAKWYRFVQLTPAQGELFRQDGWEPLYRRQQRMAELKARALARAHRGVALVRATETHHGIC